MGRRGDASVNRLLCQGALGGGHRAGATRIAIDRLTVTDTQVTGALTLGEGAVAGNLALAGGGLDGTIALSPRGGGQGIAVDLKARNASFGGATYGPSPR